MLVREEREDKLPDKYNMSELKQFLCGDVNRPIDLKEQELCIYVRMSSAIMIWQYIKEMNKKESRMQGLDCGNAHGRGGAAQEEGQWPDCAGGTQGYVSYMK